MLQAQSNCDIYCPDDFYVNADSDGNYVVEDYYALGYAYLDECNSGANVVQTPSPGTVLGLGEFEVELTVFSDGEEDDCDFDVLILPEDTTGGDCDFDCPDNLTGNADENGEYVIPDYVLNGALETNGNCGDFSYSQTPVPGTVVGVGTTYVQIEASTPVSSISCGLNLEVSGTLSTNEYDFASLSVYPNPATDIINFSVNLENIIVLTVTGKKIGVYSGNSLDVSAMKSGLYILRVENENQVGFKRILIQ
ncbi:MAG: T9SS type A sorting domain-containing protein [Aquaticitalea sp.]